MFRGTAISQFVSSTFWRCCINLRAAGNPVAGTAAPLPGASRGANLSRQNGHWTSCPSKIAVMHCVQTSLLQGSIRGMCTPSTVYAWQQMPQLAHSSSFVILQMLGVTKVNTTYVDLTFCITSTGHIQEQRWDQGRHFFNVGHVSKVLTWKHGLACNLLWYETCRHHFYANNSKLGCCYHMPCIIIVYCEPQNLWYWSWHVQCTDHPRTSCRVI